MTALERPDERLEAKWHLGTFFHVKGGVLVLTWIWSQKRSGKLFQKDWTAEVWWDSCGKGTDNIGWFIFLSHRGKQLAFSPVSLQGNSKYFLLSVFINSFISWRGRKSSSNCQNFRGILERKLALQGINAKSQTVVTKLTVQTGKVMNSGLWL